MYGLCAAPNNTAGARIIYDITYLLIHDGSLVIPLKFLRVPTEPNGFPVYEVFVCLFYMYRKTASPTFRNEIKSKKNDKKKKVTREIRNCIDDEQQ